MKFGIPTDICFYSQVFDETWERLDQQDMRTTCYSKV